MRRRDLLVVVIGASALVPVASLAQQPKVPVVGVLVAGTPDPEFALRLFRLGLQDLGYVEGRNIRIDVRSADGNSERRQAGSELAGAQPDRREAPEIGWTQPGHHQGSGGCHGWALS